jgi:hypothetical protein
MSAQVALTESLIALKEAIENGNQAKIHRHTAAALETDLTAISDPLLALRHAAEALGKPEGEWLPTELKQGMSMCVLRLALVVFKINSEKIQVVSQETKAELVG